MEENKRHQEDVLRQLKWHGRVLNLEKCMFFTSSVGFFGQYMSAKDIRPLGTHGAAIQHCPKPGMMSQLIDEFPWHAELL